MTTHTLRKVKTADKSEYVRDYHDGPMYEVIVDGVRIGRVYKTVERHQVLDSNRRICVGYTNPTYWIGDTKANDGMTAGSYSRGALVTRSTRTDAVDELIRQVTR